MSFRHFGLSFCIVSTIILFFNTPLANALSFNEEFSGGTLNGVLNTTFTVGGAWRIQNRSENLVGKANLNPNVCGGQLQSCQGVFKDQTAPARALVTAPGAASINGDDGNLNYNKYDMTQAVAKLTQDLKISYEDYEFFGRWLYFYDAVNNNFTEYHPNRITPQNASQVGYAPGNRSFITAGPGGVASPVLQAIYFPNSTIYGPGGVVQNRRQDSGVLKQAGTSFQMLDAFVSTKFDLPGERKLTVKLGRQIVNWGESTLLVINSINQANPVNANNLFRVGFQLEEVFTPVGALFASTELAPGLSVEGYYQFEWQPLEAPAPGTYLSFLDVGTDNTGKTASISFGGAAEDPSALGKPQNNPLALIANTSLTIPRLPDNEASNLGQFGIALKYYAAWLGSGTEFGLYFMNYHSKLPYASFYSTNASCARNANGTTVQLLAACPDLPIARVLSGQNPNLATSNVAPLDTAKLQLEYPENIRMLGISFNTTAGDFSFQGEVAYRPKAPLQVSTVDLAFAAFGPTLTRCSERSQACSGSHTGQGIDGQSYGPSDFTVSNGTNPYPDTIDAGVGPAILGHIPGAARAFPNFIIPYRGGTLGENPPNSYIRGYEYFQTLEYNIGGTYVVGASDNPFGADQILSVFEIGATHVPNLPDLDQLQIEGPGTYYHASAGADGSGANGSKQACSTNSACTIGPDGLRFNPHQQTDGFATKFSWGYRLINIFKYESILPGISLQPQIIFAHDVQGTAPGPAENFVEGRKTIISSFETRYKSSLSFTVGYTWFTGGGSHNLLRDRDYAQAFAKYQF